MRASCANRLDARMVNMPRLRTAGGWARCECTRGEGWVGWFQGGWRVREGCGWLAANE